ERMYAGGRIPGGFFKREGRPTEREILISRVCDRTLRPLVKDGFYYPTFIQIFVLSYDHENDTDTISIIGTLIAAKLAGIPFKKKLPGVLKIAVKNNEVTYFPSSNEVLNSDTDILIAADATGITTIELCGNEIPENKLIDIIHSSKELVEKISSHLNEFVDGLNIQEIKFEIPDFSKYKFDSERLKNALFSKNKILRENALDEYKDEFLKYIPEEEKNIALEALNLELKRIMKEEYKKGLRVDGRKFDEIRELEIIPGFLPRCHGSCMFRRGQTQAVVSITLGSKLDMQIEEGLEGYSKEDFIFHYNFPPFSTGEPKGERGVTRREIGHGNLAKKAIKKLLPELPYTIRIVADILESNGSSSMAAASGASVALYDAGIQIKSACAGVSIGMMQYDEDSYQLLTDIIGLEDHFGAMDFKVTGTLNGITAIQLDLKIPTLKYEIFYEALKKAYEGRKFIIEKMNSVIPHPRKDISPYAPKIKTIKVPKEKIGLVIGTKGTNIKKLSEEFGVEISIAEDGLCTIQGEDENNVIEAVRKIESMIKSRFEIEINNVYTGRITKVVERLGVFVDINGKEGIIHSFLVGKPLKESFKPGSFIKVRVVDINKNEILLEPV
ncbi:MAG: polyribonucleotide nucleotidyltransferase, partial [bacterium]|nr:polyribonucleotide nucleotidyltransferase [bacterium]